MDIVPLLTLAIWLAIFYITVRIAHERGRSLGLWALFAILFPGIALICALCLSKEPPQHPAEVTSLSLSMPTGNAAEQRDKQGAA